MNENKKKLSPLSRSTTAVTIASADAIPTKEDMPDQPNPLKSDTRI